MKRKLFVVICTLSLLVCNMRTIYGATGSDVVRTSYGSYTWETFTGAITIPYFNIPLDSGARVYAMIYNFDTTYSGTMEFIFNYTINTYDWYLYSFGGTANFQQSGTNYRMKIQVEECNGFAFIIAGANGSMANALVLDPNYPPSYSLTAVDTVNENLEQIWTLCNTKFANIETLLGTISTNINSIKSYVDNLEGLIYNSDNSVNSIFEFINDIEDLLIQVVDNTGTQNGLSLIQIMNQLLSIFQSGLQDSPSIYDVISGLLSTANNIKSLFDNVNLDNSDVVNAIDSLYSLLNTRLENIPQVSWNAYYFWSRFNNTVSHSSYGGYPQYNVTRTIYGAYNTNTRVYIQPNSQYVISFRATANLSTSNFVMYKYNSNADIVYSNFDTVVGSHRLETFIISNNSNAVQSVSFDLDISTNVFIVPYYVGDVLLMTDEMQMITQFYANNTIEYTTQLDNVIDLLEELGIKFDSFDFDGAELIDAVNSLYDAISELVGNITVTNNINLSNIPSYSWSAYYFWGRFNHSLSTSQYGGYPQYNITNTHTGAYQTSRRVYVKPHSRFVISFRSSGNITESIFVPYVNNNLPITFTNVESVLSTQRIENFIIQNDNDQTVSVGFDFDTSTNYFIVPHYIGYENLMTPEMQMLCQFYVGMSEQESLLAIFTILSNNQLAFQDMMTEINLIQTSLGLDLNAMLNTFLTDFNINIGKLLDFDIDIDSLFEKLLEINFDDLINFDIDIDLDLLEDLTVAIGTYIGSINDTVINYHDIWEEQYDLLDLDTKLTVPQEVTSGAQIVGNLFEDIINGDSTFAFITYSSLSIGLFGLYLGLRREK